MTFPDRHLGAARLTPVGLGCMNLNHVYRPLPTHQDAAALLNAAFEGGVRHFDTAALYGFGANEELVGEVLADRRAELFLASKCGMTGVDGKRVIDGRPETLKATAQEALRRLRTDHIDLYYLHRMDPNVPIEESVGALADLVADGLIGGIGLSEVSAATVRRAHATHPITAVQSEYSLWTRNPELGTLAVTAELGIALVAFSPLARGVLTDTPPVVADLPRGDLRVGMPRFAEPAYAQNLALRDQVAQLAEEAGVTTAQLALSWVLAQGDHVHVIPGTRSRDHMAENMATASVTVPPELLRRAGEILNANTVNGSRYAPAAASDSDSEAFPLAG
ncbi:MAG: aldo/keto reductase [Nostocoides sp.]